MDKLSNYTQVNRFNPVVTRGINAQPEQPGPADAYVGQQPTQAAPNRQQMLSYSRQGSPAPEAYEVKQGDTLFKVLLASGFSAEQIKEQNLVDTVAKSNNLKDPNRIQVGQKLQLPTGGQKPAAKPAHHQQHHKQYPNHHHVVAGHHHHWHKPVPKGGDVENSILNVKNQPKHEKPQPAFLNNPLLPKYESPFKLGSLGG